MFGDRKVDGSAAVVQRNYEKRTVETPKKSAATRSFVWFFRNVRHV